MMATLVAPILVPVALALAWHRWGHKRTLIRILWIVQLLLAISALALAWRATPLTLALGTTHWGHPAHLVLSPTAGVLIAAIHLAMVIVFAAPTWRPNADGPPTPATSLTFILIGASCAALLVDDLLLRTIVLDLASLSVGLILLAESPAPTPLGSVWPYLLLHIGDIAFLLLALWLDLTTGTWSISQAFSRAIGLSAGPRALAIAAALLAAACKLGLPPFDGWLRRAATLSTPHRIMALGAGPPLLGAYLIYRLKDLLIGDPVSKAILIAIALLCAAYAIWRALRNSTVDLSDVLVLHGALGLFAPLVGWQRGYLLCFLPVRLAICWLIPQFAGGAVETPAARAELPNVLQLLAAGAAGVDAAFASLANGLGTLSRRLGAAMQRVHSGKLRRNLLIALLALPAILLAMLASLWTGTP